MNIPSDREQIPCPDGKAGCAVIHYAPIAAPNTDSKDALGEILDRYFEARITEPEEKHLYTRLALQQINSLMISRKEVEEAIEDTTAYKDAGIIWIDHEELRNKLNLKPLQEK